MLLHDMDNITFRTFEDADYDAVIGFFVELCKDARDHINWNWARFEWMYEHPEFNKDLISSIGLWLEGERVVGASIYDMYYGEAFIGVLPSYEKLYPAVIEYAYGHLRDDNGLGIAVLDTDDKLIYMLRQKGFLATGQDETVLSADLSGHKSPVLPEGIRIEEMDPGDDLYKFGWMLWRGFDHGDNREEFEADLREQHSNKRKHFCKHLSLTAVTDTGENVSYCCLWYLEETDYAYVEPVCTVPSFRGKGIAGALLGEALNRAADMGAKTAYVISGSDFYRRSGFSDHSHYSFLWKKSSVEVGKDKYSVVKLLGHGKGGYSYLCETDGKRFILKQLHHEPCSYYSFGDKMQAELHDYEVLRKAGIRIPEMLSYDTEREMIIKEYIEGPTIYEMVKNDIPVDSYLAQVREMADKAKANGINIDYFPTNFVASEGQIWYIDYECNGYMDEWSFDNWGIKYWSKTPEFIDHMNRHGM